MTCKNIQDLLWGLCEGSLPEGEARSVRLHLEGCPACSRAMAEVEVALGAMRNLPELEPGMDFQAKVWQRIDAWEAGRQGFWRGVWAGFVYRNRRVLGTAALAFVVALAGGIYVMKTFVGPQTRVAEQARPSYEGIVARIDQPAASQQGVEQDFVLRDIPYRAPVMTVSGRGTADTIYTRFPTREVAPPLVTPRDTYVFQPVTTPVTVGEPVY